MVEDLGRHEWIKKYLRRKAGTRCGFGIEYGQCDGEEVQYWA